MWKLTVLKFQQTFCIWIFLFLFPFSCKNCFILLPVMIRVREDALVVVTSMYSSENILTALLGLHTEGNYLNVNE